MRINAKVMRALEKSVARENYGAARAAEKARETKERPAHLAFGVAAEETAARYLAGLGYTILHRNVRVGHCEIDIIARDGDELVFAEVRARRANPVAAPEDTVGPVKLERLTRAAELWTQNANYMGFWRIDLVAVTLYDGGEMNIELIKNITEPVI